MGFWDCYCFICGGPIQNYLKKNDIVYDENENEIIIDEDIIEFLWLDKLSLLKTNNKVITLRDYKYDSYGNVFKYNKNITEYNITPLNWNKNDENNGLICHTDCYNFLSKLYSKKIVYENVKDLINEYGTLLDDNDYQEPVSNYVGMQEWNFYHILNNKDYYSSPFLNKINAKRLTDIWTNKISF